MDALKHFMNGFYLALVYLVISGNYLGNLFGCRVQQIFSQTMWLKHLLGLFTTYFLIILASPPEDYTHTQTLFFSIFIYVWFFFTTKMHVQFWIPMILCVMAAYCIYIYLKQRNQRKESEKEDTQTKLLDSLQDIATVAAGLLTIVGVAAYYGEKKIEYGKSFDTGTFWRGKHICKAKTPNIPIQKSLKVLFS
jgi:Ca2+/Na+ antiporter